MPHTRQIGTACPWSKLLGMTNMDSTFVLGIAFIRHEKKEQYTWVMRQLKRFCCSEDCQPKIMATDRELALMNAIEEVFSDVNHLLCRWHISKNIVSNILSHFPGIEGEQSKKLMREWAILSGNPNSEIEFKQNLERFKSLVREIDVSSANKSYSSTKLIDHIDSVWLVHKERFGTVWTNRITQLNSGLFFLEMCTFFDEERNS